MCKDQGGKHPSRCSLPFADRERRPEEAGADLILRECERLVDALHGRQPGPRRQIVFHLLLNIKFDEHTEHVTKVQLAAMGFQAEIKAHTSYPKHWSSWQSERLRQLSHELGKLLYGNDLPSLWIEVGPSIPEVVDVAPRDEIRIGLAKAREVLKDDSNNKIEDD